MSKSRRRAKKPGKSPGNSKSPDAIQLLKADHREVSGWFAQVAKATSAARKQELARKICRALRVHTTIEEEIFYPLFLQLAHDKPLHHEAEIEHQAAKHLIGEIEESSPKDDYFDAKLKVLSEMIKHHVKEEEQPGGMFAEARKAKMDLSLIGARLADRKQQLMEGSRPHAAGPVGSLLVPGVGA